MKIADNPSVILYGQLVAEYEKRAATIQQRQTVAKFKQKYHELIAVPDDFNKVFANRGWIAYENLSPGVMKRALLLEKTKGVIKAEEHLVEYYDQVAVRIGIPKLWSVKCFKDRLHLIKLAYEDYICGRYHACIPLILMMVDGAVADSGDNLGFAAEKSDVKAWDSVAGHDTGLETLKKIVLKSRTTTQKGKITLPYRNGILHGRDLGYANREVAAKSWALLFAVRDVLDAQGSEESRKQKYAIDKTLTIEDIEQNLKKIEEGLIEVSLMNSFKRKPIVLGRDCPFSGEPDDYSADTPERALVEFIELWKKKNYGGMADCVAIPDYLTKGKMAGLISKTFKDKQPKQFIFKEINDLSSCTVELSVEIEISYSNDLPQQYPLKFRILYCKKDSAELVPNPAREGRWKIAQEFSTINQIGTIQEHL